MNSIIQRIQKEPVAFQALMQTILAALIGFGLLRWSPEQVGLVLAVLAAVLAFTRQFVTPNASVPSTESPPTASPETAGSITVEP